MITITEFLLARINEEEAAVPYRPAPTLGDDVLAQFDEAQHGYRPLKPGVLTVTSARVLAECESKQRIIEEHQMWKPSGYRFTDGRQIDVCTVDEQHWPCRTMKALASVYAEHPDFRSEWTYV